MGKMDKYLCVCGWVYDPELGDQCACWARTPFPPCEGRTAGAAGLRLSVI